MNSENLISYLKDTCKIRSNAHRHKFKYYRKIHITIGLPSALLATLAGSIATINAGNEAEASFSLLEIISVAVTWAVALLASANSFLNPHQTSLGHRDKATGYDVQLGKIFKAEAFKEGDELEKELGAIHEKIEELQQSEPILSDSRINKTKKLLRVAGELHSEPTDLPQKP
jgi:hypothetical protein